jgi:hypothetical protein
MIKKALFVSLFCIFSLFPGVVMAVDDTVTAFMVYSDNSIYKHFPTAKNSYNMSAFLIDTTAPDRSVSVGNLPATNPDDSKQLPYLSGWSDLIPYLYVASLLPPTYPAPGAEWENRPFQFTIAETGQSIGPFTIPVGALHQLGAATISVSGGKHPTITWGHVAGATQYRIRFFPLNSSGNPNLSDLVFQSAPINDTGPGNYSFTYQGNLFNTKASLAIAVEAYEYADNLPTNPFYNRSRSFVPYPYPIFLPLIKR